jgi:NADH-ubiquinone oxidoreductase chain 1
VLGGKMNVPSVRFLMAALTVVMINSNMWILIGLAIMGYGFISGVYYSECMYSLLGGLRAVVGMLSYELILLMVLLISWNAHLIVALFVFSVEVGRTPTDLVEGESELVSRFNTEYAGGVFVGFFLGEYLSLLIFFLFF